MLIKTKELKKLIMISVIIKMMLQFTLIEKQNVDIDIKGYDAQTPLVYACKKGHLQIIEYLISKGADVNEEHKDGLHVIHYAAMFGHLDIVQYLVERQNIDVNIKGTFISNIKTPLHFACKFGYLPIVEYLISKGANIEAKDELEQTPLHYASDYGIIDIVKYLVSKGANKNAKDFTFKTPYDLARKDEIRNILK